MGGVDVDCKEFRRRNATIETFVSLTRVERLECGQHLFQGCRACDSFLAGVPPSKTVTGEQLRMLAMRDAAFLKRVDKSDDN